MTLVMISFCKQTVKPYKSLLVIGHYIYNNYTCMYICFLGRPYVVTRGLLFYPWCFLSFFFRHTFSEFPRPIALKLCHLIRICVYFIMQVQKLGGHSHQKIRGPKTRKISVNFAPLQTLIANICGTAEYIQNRPALQTMAIPPAFNEKGPVNFGPLTAWNYMWVWTH